MITLPPQVNTALALLEKAGHEAYVVGGAVRDLLRGAPVQDWDLTTSALPEQTKAVFEGYRLIDTGLKHGTVTVLLNGMPLEITTYRVEGGYSDHRRPDSVSFTASLTEDLARRDFTVNAMAWRPDRGVIDPFGGQEDLRRRTLRCVGDPDRRFREDALRMLRALRFSARLGFAIEEDTAHAIRRNRELLSVVAAERVRAELTGLLCGSCVEPVLRAWPDVLAVPIPEVAPLVGFQQHNRHHCHDVWGHISAVVAAAPAEPALRWAALLHDFGKPACFTMDDRGVGHFKGHAAVSAQLADRILERLRFDNATRDQVRFLVEWHHLFVTDGDIRRAVQAHGAAGVKQLLWLFRADTLGKSPRSLYHLDEFKTLSAAIDRMERLTPKDLALNGHDLLALGYDGPAIGAALDALVDAVVFGGLKNERGALLDHLNENNR